MESTIFGGSDGKETFFKLQFLPLAGYASSMVPGALLLRLNCYMRVHGFAQLFDRFSLSIRSGVNPDIDNNYGFTSSNPDFPDFPDFPEFVYIFDEPVRLHAHAAHN